MTVDFSLIKNQDKSLFDKFEEAYNDDGLGVMIINNVPGYVERRKALLPLAQKLANLPKNVLESLECPEYLYGVGWSHGREKFKGIPDFLKGSYYANPWYEAFKSNSLDEEGNPVVFYNRWPKEDLPELEPAFQNLGGLINDVGIELATNLDK